MDSITKNYGLKGGTLDATRHIQAAEKIMCFPSEISARQKLAQRLASVSASSPDRADAARSN